MGSPACVVGGQRAGQDGAKPGALLRSQRRGGVDDLADEPGALAVAKRRGAGDLLRDALGRQLSAERGKRGAIGVVPFAGGDLGYELTANW